MPGALAAAGKYMDIAGMNEHEQTRREILFTVYLVGAANSDSNFLFGVFIALAVINATVLLYHLIKGE